MNALEMLLMAVVVVGIGVIAYVVVICLTAYHETKKTDKVDFFTCDKHGAFPVKLLMEIDLQDGQPPVKQCPFCLDEAYKQADARLKAEEAKHAGK